MLAITVRAKNLKGEIPDRRALAEVRTYCVQKSGLSSSDRYILDGFLKTESKPKHLLTKLPWKLVENCRDGRPDAIATVEFVPLHYRRLVLGEPTGPRETVTDSRDPEAPIKVVLTVRDSSQKLLYRAQAMPLTSDEPDRIPPPGPAHPPEMPPRHGGPVERQDAVYHVFWALIGDLQAMHGSTTK